MFSFLKKKNGAKKVVILGLDGVPYSLLASYMSKGVMPRLADLCATRGKLVKMKSTLPEISSVAWSSFMTGKNPGEHGIFGFMELDRQTYDFTFPNFSALKARPFWEKGETRAVVCNIPQTYPAAPMNGVMVSGFVALDLKKATYPERVFHFLEGIGYRIDVNARLAPEDPDAFFRDLFLTFDKRVQAINHLFDNEEWQLFISAITETDRLHHFFFDSAIEGKHYQVFERFYGELDRFIDSMARKAIEQGAVFITCSDHGFTPIITEVYINRWLVENGYLKLAGTAGLKGIDAESTAFCLDPSRIYIHLAGKYGRGRVREEDYHALRSELKDKLLDLTFQGRKVIKDAFFKEEIFTGDFAENGPDLYLLPHYGFDLKGAVNRESVFGTSGFRGMHTYDDAHLLIIPGEDIGEISIDEVAGIALSHMR